MRTEFDRPDQQRPASNEASEVLPAEKQQGRLKPLLFFLIVGSIAGYFVYREVTRVGKPGVLNIGQLAPDFTLKDESGRPVKLSDYRGKLVFLNFWATWCGPCVDEMPAMEVMNKILKDRKFQMLTVSIDIKWEPVREFYKKYNLTLPVVLVPGQQVARDLYKATGWPETFLIDANGHLIKHVIGPARWADPQVLSQIENMLPEEQAGLQIPRR
jgi:peroxiredoxin